MTDVNKILFRTKISRNFELLRRKCVPFDVATVEDLSSVGRFFGREKTEFKIYDVGFHELFRI